MHRLSALDLSLVAIYLAGITIFGLQFRSKDRSLKNYFLADRNIPWWAIALSIVAAETSTLTIISIPGLAYTTNLGFLQIAAGYLLGRIVVAYTLLPRYYQGDLVTAYADYDRAKVLLALALKNRDRLREWETLRRFRRSRHR